MKKNRFKIIGILGAICLGLYFLYPTWRSNQIDQELARVSTDSTALSQYNETNREDITKARKGRIKLGLDLRGGIYVTMEVDVLKLIEETAQNKDVIFNSVIDATVQEEKTSEENVVAVFDRNFKRLAEPQGKSLASYFYFGDVRESDDKSILDKLQKEVDGAVERALEVIRNRVDQYGLVEPTIQKQGSRRVILELPGVSNETEVHELLQGTARLEFKMLKEPEVFVKIIKAIDKAVAGKSFADSTGKDSSVVAKKDSTSNDSSVAADESDTANPYAGLSDQEASSRFKVDHPFFAYAQVNKQSNVPVMYVFDHDRARVTAMLRSARAAGAIPDGTDFLWSQETFPGQNGEQVRMLYAANAQAELTGEVVTDARATVNQQGGPVVSMSMNDEGTREWARITGSNKGKFCAIVLDSIVYSAPRINEKIPSGNSEISGSKSIDEARLLAIVLKAGALPAPVQIIEERVVGPSLGQDSIDKGTFSSLVAFIIIVLFMIFYYRTGGLVADVAVIINLLIVMAVLAAFGATLTLPGIAGMMLTVGMAVDANVLIYERIREEITRGRSLASALSEGYSKAFSAIFDANITAFGTAVILYAFGTGPVQGFAVTLMIGIAASLFTAIVVTRVVFEIMVDRGTTAINFG